MLLLGAVRHRYVPPVRCTYWTPSGPWGTHVNLRHTGPLAICDTPQIFSRRLGLRPRRAPIPHITTLTGVNRWLDPPGANPPPSNLLSQKTFKITKLPVGVVVRVRQPPLCPHSPVHRSDPLRPLGDPGDPHDTPVRLRYATPPIFYVQLGLRPRRAPNPLYYHPQWCKLMTGPPGQKPPSNLFCRKSYKMTK